MRPVLAGGFFGAIKLTPFLQLPVHKRFIASAVFALLALLMLGCTQPSASAPAPVPSSTTEPTAGASSTPTPTPTITPTPAPNPTAVLVSPEGSDPAQASALAALLGELTREQGYKLRSLTALSQADMTPDMRVVAVLQPFPALAELAAAFPQTEFIGLGFPELKSTENLTLVDPQAASADQMGFLAGYLAGVVTPDWRAGVISTGESPDGTGASQGFTNGLVFYCGLCRPAYPPFVQYPVSLVLPPGAGSTDQQAAADALVAQGVTTVFLAPGADSPEMRQILAENGLNLIGTSSPEDSIRPSWIATIQADWLAGVRQAWEGAVAGEPDSFANPVLEIVDVNEAILTEGRLRLVEQVRDELAADLIDTGVNPDTGEILQ